MSGNANDNDNGKGHGGGGESRGRAAALVRVEALAAELERFAAEREWQPFHAPKNLVMALSGEVGELTEIFQWLTEEESRHVARDAATAAAVRDELADVMMYLVRLASMLGVDLDEAVRAKLAANERRYPVETARGNARKHRRRS